MNPIKRAQIVKFNTPFEDEDPNQVYVVLEVFECYNQIGIKSF